MAAIMGVGVTCCAYTLYVCRHPWFVAHGGAWAIALGGGIAALAVAAAVAEMLLGPRARRWSVLGIALSLVVASTVDTWSWAHVHAPSELHARVLFQLGQTREAFSEADAVDSVRRSSRSVVDDLHLAEIPSGATVDDLHQQALRRWRTDAAPREVLQRLRAAAIAEADALVRASDARKRDTWVSWLRRNRLHQEHMQHLAGLVTPWFQDLQRLFVGRAALFDTFVHCLSEPAEQPDAGCFDDVLARANQGGVPASEVAPFREEFEAWVRAWEQARLAEQNFLLSERNLIAPQVNTAVRSGLE